MTHPNDPLIPLPNAGNIAVALMGNPNTGKSTIFNGLTGLRQHTGNWPGKTVQLSKGTLRFADRDFTLVDLPGTYSLDSMSQDEEVAREYLVDNNPDATIVVTDATALERNLILVLQVLQTTDRIVVAVNLLDEAERKGLAIDLERLEQELGVPVIGMQARNGKGFDALMKAVVNVVEQGPRMMPSSIRHGFEEQHSQDERVRLAEAIAFRTVSRTRQNRFDWDAYLDRVLTSPRSGLLVMLLMLGVVLWITIAGANRPSELLANLFFFIEPFLTMGLQAIGAPDWLNGFLVLGVYRGLAWVVAVMLPPMAIFFPLFTFLEDLGYLPRIAFNMDPIFRRAGAQGKQALTMAMGLGCNAAGVIACRIIDSPRERLIAILTNNFVPCNGRWPILFTLASIFMGGAVAAGYGTLLSTTTVVSMVLVGIVASLATSWALSRTLLRGYDSTFILELPPYRIPKVGQVIVRSVFDRTLFVLWRAVKVAAPAGGIIWILGNISYGDSSLMGQIAGWLDPLGQFMGLDGMILLAFILGLPANEIVIPILMMGYLATGEMIELNSLGALRDVFVQNGWTWLTALNTMLFAILHYPCATTLLTIKKETGSAKWTFLAAAIPLAIGMVATVVVATVVRSLGWV